MSQFMLTIEAKYGKMYQTKIYVGQMSGKKYAERTLPHENTQVDLTFAVHAFHRRLRAVRVRRDGGYRLRAVFRNHFP